LQICCVEVTVETYAIRQWVYLHVGSCRTMFIDGEGRHEVIVGKESCHWLLSMRLNTHDAKFLIKFACVLAFLRMRLNMLGQRVHQCLLFHGTDK